MRRLALVAVASGAAGALVGWAVGRDTGAEESLRTWQAGFLAGARQARRTERVRQATARYLHPTRFSPN